MIHKKYTSLYTFMLLLNLNSCCTQKPTKPSDPLPPDTKTTTTTQPKKEYGSVINFNDLVNKYGSESEALGVVLATEMVVLDFSAEWCPPCKQLAPHFAAVAKQYPSLLCIKIDIDQFNNIGKRYQVRSMPTLICLRNGTKIGSLNGLMSQKALTTELSKIFSL